LMVSDVGLVSHVTHLANVVERGGGGGQQHKPEAGTSATVDFMGTRSIAHT